MPETINILGLDPGLTIAWAVFRLEGKAFRLLSYGCARYPEKVHGNAGRELVHQWASELLVPFGSADEVASDNELAGAGLSTNVPALGAFDAAREFGRAHGRRVQAGRVFGEYARRSYVSDVGQLSGLWTREGREFWRPKATELRAALSILTGKPLEDTRGQRHHCLDAIACGIGHAHRAHRWQPQGYRAPRKAPLVTVEFINRIDAKRLEVTR